MLRASDENICKPQAHSNCLSSTLTMVAHVYPTTQCGREGRPFSLFEVMHVMYGFKSSENLIWVPAALSGLFTTALANHWEAPVLPSLCQHWAIRLLAEIPSRTSSMGTCSQPYLSPPYPGAGP